MEGPFRPYIDLRRQEAGFRFADEEAVRVYMAEGKPLHGE
jgi:hypothetical protein